MKRKAIDFKISSINEFWQIQSRSLDFDLTEPARVITRVDDGSKRSILEVGTMGVPTSQCGDFEFSNPFRASEFDIELIEGVVRHYINQMLQSGLHDRNFLTRLAALFLPAKLLGTIVLEDIESIPPQSIRELRDQLTEFGLFKSLDIIGAQS